MSTRREIIGVLGSGTEEHRAWVEPLARCERGFHLLSGARGTEPMSRNHLNVLTAHALVALPGGAGTVSEVVLALRYGKPIILLGPPGSFGDFPSEVERTESLERVSDFLISVPRESVSSSG